MVDVKLIGQVPKPHNGGKWKIIVGGKEIYPSKDAIPSTVPYANASIRPFLEAAERFSQEHQDAFEVDDATEHNK